MNITQFLDGLNTCTDFAAVKAFCYQDSQKNFVSALASKIPYLNRTHYNDLERLRDKIHVLTQDSTSFIDQILENLLKQDSLVDFSTALNQPSMIEILSHCSNQRDLLSLASTCRGMNTAVAAYRKRSELSTGNRPLRDILIELDIKPTTDNLLKFIQGNELRSINLEGLYEFDLCAIFPHIEWSLEKIVVDSCFISDTTLSSIAQHSPNLKVLELKRPWLFLFKTPDITDVGIRALVRGCPFLEVIAFPKCTKVSREGWLEVARHCSRIKRISIEDATDINDQFFQELAVHCDHIEAVNFNNSRLPMKELGAFLLRCPRLTEIKIASPSQDTDLLQDILYQFRGIRVLDITGLDATPSEQTEGVMMVLTRLKHLEKLKLSVAAFNDEWFAVALPYMKQLTSLELVAASQPPHLTQSTNAIAESCSDLECVSFPKAVVYENALIATIRANPKLKKITFNTNIGNDVLRSIWESCPNLIELRCEDHNSVPSMTEEAVITLLTRCKKIKNLSLPFLTLRIVQTIRANCKQIHSVRVKESSIDAFELLSDCNNIACIEIKSF